MSFHGYLGLDIISTRAGRCWCAVSRRICCNNHGKTSQAKTFHNNTFRNKVLLCFWEEGVFLLYSLTKLLLTPKSEVIIYIYMKFYEFHTSFHEKELLSRRSRGCEALKNYQKNNFQGIIFVIVLCQRAKFTKSEEKNKNKNVVLCYGLFRA